MELRDTQMNCECEYCGAAPTFPEVCSFARFRPAGKMTEQERQIRKRFTIGPSPGHRSRGARRLTYTLMSWSPVGYFVR